MQTHGRAGAGLAGWLAGGSDSYGWFFCWAVRRVEYRRISLRRFSVSEQRVWSLAEPLGRNAAL